jgi:sulfatase modifying factor 1
MTSIASRSRAAKRGKLANMRLIRGREFLMGSDHHYPEEAPARLVAVGDFWIDEHPVTNAQFAAFVAQTGHVTFAEIPPDPRDYPGVALELARPGSAVFAPPAAPVSLEEPGGWWRFEFDANWRRPYGRGSAINAIMDHPVVQVAFADAQAYARWAGKALPSEAEWEFAARGGLEGAAFAWGEDLSPGGRPMANRWHGQFPWENTGEDGYFRTSPVGAFPANGFGLHDMIGNVWEWTVDPFDAAADSAAKRCCGPAREPENRIGRKVLKGGSHLCAPNYCQRYRPAARYAQPVDSPTTHIGFRCIVRR